MSENRGKRVAEVSDRLFVSVVVATYNRRDLLQELVESLFRQTYPGDRYEVIIVDDGSTDGTMELFETISRNAPRTIRVLSTPRNCGPGTARNLGIKSARGDAIAFTDSDCVADERWLECAVAQLAPGVGLVQGRTLPKPGQRFEAFSRGLVMTREDGVYAGCNVVYRKEALDVVGGFSNEFCGTTWFGRVRIGGEDTDLGWRVKKQGFKSVFAHDAVIFHHVFHRGALEFLGDFQVKLLYELDSWPRVVRLHPEIRQFFILGLFRFRESALFLLLLVGAVAAATVHPAYLASAAPYLIRRARTRVIGRGVKAPHRAIAVLLVYFLEDLMRFVFIGLGCIRHRTIVF